MYQMIVVDDEAELREGISNYFPWESLNIRVTGIFENGRTAFAYLKAHPVDIVLTDIRMPFIDGLELIEKAKSVSPSTCYVILSGYREFEYAKKGLLLGVKDYILKPTKYSQIYEVFSRITAELDHSAAAERQMCIRDRDMYPHKSDNQNQPDSLQRLPEMHFPLQAPFQLLL